MPALAGKARRSFTWAGSIPAIEIVPGATGKTPIRHKKSVVFPAPFGPTIPTLSPAAIENETPASAGCPPGYVYARSRTDTDGSLDTKGPSHRDPAPDPQSQPRSYHAR